MQQRKLRPPLTAKFVTSRPGAMPTRQRPLSRGVGLVTGGSGDRQQRTQLFQTDFGKIEPGPTSIAKAQISRDYQLARHRLKKREPNPQLEGTQEKPDGLRSPLKPPSAEAPALAGGGIGSFGAGQASSSVSPPLTPPLRPPQASPGVATTSGGQSISQDSFTQRVQQQNRNSTLGKSGLSSNVGSGKRRRKPLIAGNPSSYTA